MNQSEATYVLHLGIKADYYEIKSVTCDIFGSDLSSQPPQSRRGKVLTDIVFSFFANVSQFKENKASFGVFTWIGTPI